MKITYTVDFDRQLATNTERETYLVTVSGHSHERDAAPGKWFLLLPFVGKERRLPRQRGSFLQIYSSIGDYCHCIHQGIVSILYQLMLMQL